MTNLVLRIVIFVAPFIVVGGLVLHHADPDGVRTLSYTVDETSPYVNSLLPSDRVEDVRDTERGAAQRIIDEPVYFSVEPPGEGYEEVRVELAFDPHEQPVVELGALTDIAAYAFDFRPMANSVLEDLDWPRLTFASNGVQTVLFSRDDVNATVEDFLLHPPERSSIATYRATFPTPYTPTNYTPLSGMRTVTTSLRGSHTFLTYVKNEDVTLSVTYSDVNRTFGADEGSISIWSEDGTLMAQRSLVDDHNTSEDQTPSKTTLTLAGSDWKEGVYRVELSGTSDIMWRQIQTSLRYVTFKNRLYIGDDVGYREGERAHAFVTNADRVTVETFHAESPDEVVIDGITYAIASTHTKVELDLPASGVASGSVSAGDIKMTGEGKFALDESMFFDPDPVPLTPFTSLDGISYIYATMAVPSTEDGWRTADATFDIASLALENGAYKFAISTPGLAALGATVDLHAIELTFTRPPVSLFQALENEARLFWRALKDVL